MLIVFATAYIIELHFILANSLPRALPPTVNEATNALIMNWILKASPRLWVIFIVNIALIAPLSTPHMSPITSLQIFETFGAERINFIEKTLTDRLAEYCKERGAAMPHVNTQRIGKAIAEISKLYRYPYAEELFEIIRIKAVH